MDDNVRFVLDQHI